MIVDKCVDFCGVALFGRPTRHNVGDGVYPNKQNKKGIKIGDLVCYTKRIEMCLVVNVIIGRSKIKMHYLGII